MQGILFDLDGTLLDIDIETFLARYFAVLADAVAELAADTTDHERAMRGIHLATRAMMDRHPGETNRETFYREFRALTGIDLNDRWEVFERFYEEVFPTLGDGLGPTRGALDVLEAAETCGLRIAIATNPIFPLRAVEHRLAWAGIDPKRAHVITSFEVMESCKPQPEYYRQTCSMLGVEPGLCLMVGDDRLLDLPAADIGMRTFYVGPDEAAPADYAGDLSALAEALPRLCGFHSNTDSIAGPA